MNDSLILIYHYILNDFKDFLISIYSQNRQILLTIHLKENAFLFKFNFQQKIFSIISNLIIQE